MVTDAYAQLSRLLEIGRFREAEQVLAPALAQAPVDPDLNWFAARIAAGLDDVPRAEEHVQRALSVDPGHFGARFLLFALYFDANRLSEAEGVITGLIREYPGDATLLAYYADLNLRALDLVKARALANEALRRDPEDARARRVDVLLLTIEGRHAAAGDQLAELIRDDPESDTSARTLFVTLVQQKRYREALEIGRQLLRLDPGNPELVAALAELRAATHWIAAPAYPIHRFGWAGAAAVWAGGVVISRVLIEWHPTLGASFLAIYLLYIVYTWVYPPLLKRWLVRKGF